MIRLPLCCRCARLKDFKLGEYQKIVAHCEAYPDGIPEAVFYAGHIFAKPDDNGLQFTPKNPDEKIRWRRGEKAENQEYRELKSYYEILDMPDDEWVKLMQKEKKLSDNPIEIEIELEFRQRRETEPRKW